MFVSCCCNFLYVAFEKICKFLESSFFVVCFKDFGFLQVRIVVVWHFRPCFNLYFQALQYTRSKNVPRNSLRVKQVTRVFVVVLGSCCIPLFVYGKISKICFTIIFRVLCAYRIFFLFFLFFISFCFFLLTSLNTKFSHFFFCFFFYA